jgi:hypothetical protein
MIRGHFRQCRRLKSLSRLFTSLTGQWWNPIRIAFPTKSRCRTPMKTPTRRNGSVLFAGPVTAGISTWIVRPLA